FWSMNAFFRQTKMNTVRAGRETDFGTLRNDDFAGEGSTPKEAEIYFELRNGQMQVAYPKFVDGTAINPSGFKDEVNRRAELAKFKVTFGNDEGEDATTFNGTIPQALMMMNGSMVKDATSDKDGSILKWLAQNSTPSEAIEYLYLSAFARKPTSGELGLSNA